MAGAQPEPLSIWTTPHWQRANSNRMAERSTLAQNSGGLTETRDIYSNFTYSNFTGYLYAGVSRSPLPWELAVEAQMQAAGERHFGGDHVEDLFVGSDAGNPHRLLDSPLSIGSNYRTHQIRRVLDSARRMHAHDQR